MNEERSIALMYFVHDHRSELYTKKTTEMPAIARQQQQWAMRDRTVDDNIQIE